MANRKRRELGSFNLFRRHTKACFLVFLCILTKFVCTLLTDTSSLVYSYASTGTVAAHRLYPSHVHLLPAATRSSLEINFKHQ